VVHLFDMLTRPERQEVREEAARLLAFAMPDSPYHDVRFVCE
jgi:hypothetical protein